MVVPGMSHVVRALEYLEMLMYIVVPCSLLVWKVWEKCRPQPREAEEERKEEIKGDGKHHKHHKHKHHDDDDASSDASHASHRSDRSDR